jgi:diguanylate cyclase (GGDEF)-like protein/PAS domain S-box-containing protein
MPRHQEPHQFDLIDAIEEAVCFLTEDWKIAFANDRLAEVLGGTTADFLGKDFRSFFPEDRLESLEIAYRNALEGERVRLQVGMNSILRPEPIPVLLRFVRYTDFGKEGSCLFAIILDLSELYEALRAQEFLRQRNRELEDMAITCPLTTIYNRRYFDYRYSEEMRRARRYQHGLGLAVADVDRFKSINDTYGHLVGDEVLRQVAQTLKRALRNSDVLARIGGDEFAAILPEAHPSGALAVGLRMRMRAQTTEISTTAGILKATVSVGIVCLSPPDESVSDEAFFRRADEALYLAKGDGRNRAVLWGHPI